MKSLRAINVTTIVDTLHQDGRKSGYVLVRIGGILVLNKKFSSMEQANQIKQSIQQATRTKLRLVA